MTADEIKKLVQAVGKITWYENLNGIPGKGWFLLEASPIPPFSEKYLVAADILKNGAIQIKDGILHHSNHCTFNGHNLPKNIKKALDILTETKYTIAIFQGESGILEGQPIAIPLIPSISYIHYPDHPHLNSGRFALIQGKRFYIPDSLCYTDNPSVLGENTFNRIFEASIQILMWIFRHQVWEVTRSIKKPGIWIGPQVKNPTPEICALFLNPGGPCRCGLDKAYEDCHLPRDIQKITKSIPDTVKLNNRVYSHFRWHTQIKNPHTESIEKFLKAFNISQA
jgi:hypothetical protein